MNNVIRVHNVETGEVTELEVSAEELALREASHQQAEQWRAEEQAKKDARQSALSKLVDLGLTEEEIAAL
jgi:DNA-binding NarL/FixJ family response regulator